MTKTISLRPNKRSDILAGASKTAVKGENAWAEEEAVWSDVKDSEARGSGNAQEDETCRPCGESVTAEPAEAAPVKIAKDPGDPTEEEFENHCVTHLPFRRW